LQGKRDPAGAPQASYVETLYHGRAGLLPVFRRTQIIRTDSSGELMKKNLGSADRIIRALLAILLGTLVLTGELTGTRAVVLGIVAVFLLATSTVSFCPAYLPFKISTMKKSGAGK
jgi:hypothetical protein